MIYHKYLCIENISFCIFKPTILILEHKGRVFRFIFIIKYVLDSNDNVFNNI